MCSWYPKTAKPFRLSILGTIRANFSFSSISFSSCRFASSSSSFVRLLNSPSPPCSSPAAAAAAIVSFAALASLSATLPPSMGRCVPLRAYHKPHALHNERTPSGPLRINGVELLPAPQLEHRRPPFPLLLLLLFPVFNFNDDDEDGFIPGILFSNRRAISSTMHFTASSTSNNPFLFAVVVVVVVSLLSLFEVSGCCCCCCCFSDVSSAF